MKKTLLVTTNLARIASVLGLFLFLSVGITTVHAATVSVQLDMGSSGQQVTDLQTYLATNVNVYPEGLVTGYFGSLTQAAVQRFQVAQGIVSSGTPTTTGYGHVGPATIARLNMLMGSTLGYDAVPVQGPITIQQTNTTATIAWTNNEPTVGQLFWSTTPIQSDEATGPHQTPYVSGTLAVDAAGNLQTNHTITISNLQTNTTYYYLVRSIDSAGNITMTFSSPFSQNSFRTNNY